ncbi:MAG: HAD family hydrolase [Ilumatobacteraceae bacterium]
MSVTLNWSKFDAVLFDLDGVLTPTAELHERAWSALFADHGFGPVDYLTHVDGKPRYDGVHSFLAARGIDVPWGDPADPPGRSTVCALGNLKNSMFDDLLRSDGVTPYAGSTAVLALLAATGVPAAVVSSSKNATRVLAAAGLGTRFEVVVDGLVAEATGLAGKPDPETFLHAADLIGAAPEHSVVVEDAASGVTAGVAGGFGLVIGVDRGGNRRALLGCGADVVVDDLADTLGSRTATVVR